MSSRSRHKSIYYRHYKRFITRCSIVNPYDTQKIRYILNHTSIRLLSKTVREPVKRR